MSTLDDLIAQNAAIQAPSAQAAPTAQAPTPSAAPAPMSSLDALIAQNAALAPPQPQAQASKTVSQPAPTPTTTPQQGSQWQTPGSLVMGAGDAVKGYTQSLVHGMSWLADKVAPNSQFAQDARGALPQMQNTIDSQNAQYAAAQPPNSGIDWGRIAGQAGGTAMVAGGGMAAPEGLAGKALVGGLSGVLSTAAQPVTNLQPGQTYADQKLDQMTTNGLIGSVAGPVTGALGSALSGVTAPAQQALAQAGVKMTPGQMLGGAWAKIEDQATSIPILGDFIKNGQQNAVQSFNRATYNNALAPIGGAIPSGTAVGSDAIASIRNQIGNVYSSIEPRATFVADQNFGNDLAGIRANLAQTAPATLDQFDNIVANQVTAKLDPNRALTGAQWGNTRSEISGIARNQMLGNATPDNRSLAGALGDLNDAINAGVGRSSPPDILPTLQKANASYSQYKQIEAAAGSAGASNNGNIFTPAQFTNAVRKGETSAQKAQNSGLNAQFGAQAQDVLGAKYPNSGTPGRAALMAALGAIGGHEFLPPGVAGPAIAGGAAMAAPYTKYGQALTQALLMSRPAGAVPVGNALSTYGVPFTSALGTSLFPSIAGSK